MMTMTMMKITCLYIHTHMYTHTHTCLNKINKISVTRNNRSIIKSKMEQEQVCTCSSVPSQLCLFTIFIITPLPRRACVILPHKKVKKQNLCINLETMTVLIQIYIHIFIYTIGHHFYQFHTLPKAFFQWFFKLNNT